MRGTSTSTIRLLVVALLAHVVILVVTYVLSSRSTKADFNRFWEIGSTRGRPYVDYQVERGPLETLVLKSIAAATGTRARFGRVVVLVNIAADVAILAALAWGWGVAATTYFAVVALPLLNLLCERIDLWSVAAATIAIGAWKRDRRIVTAIALVIGGAFKVWPLPLAVLLLEPGTRRSRAVPVLTFAALAALFGIAWWVLAGWSGVYQVLTFRGARGWQVESTVGALLLIGGGSAVRMEAGAHRLGSTGRLTSIASFGLAGPAYVWSVWRGGRTGRVGVGWLTGVSALLILSPLFSTQFMGWLMPAAAIAWAEGDRLPAALAAAAVALTMIEWSFYLAIVKGVLPAVLLVVTRNVLMAAVVSTGFTILTRAAVRRFMLPYDPRPVERLKT